MEIGDLLWTPSAARINKSHLTAFMRWLAKERGLKFASYGELWQWSVDDLEAFWQAIWDYFEVQSSAPYERVLADRRMPGAKWFPGARLNYAQHALRHERPNAVALMYLSERTPLSHVSWAELGAKVRILATQLRKLGVEPGDRVVAYLPNAPETIIAMLATTSIGAVWSSCGPDFGTRGVLDRYSQLTPKVMFCVDGYQYGGKPFDRKVEVQKIIGQLDSLRHVVYLPYLNRADAEPLSAHTILWDELFEHPAVPPDEFEFEQVPFEHPLWILFSSGTTGLPKPICHSHGGIILEQLKHLAFNFDVHPGERLFFFTTTGWMMWNFLVGALLTPAAIVLYDGSPGHPDLGVLWDLAESAGVTCFGTSASYLASCLKEGVEPAAGRDLSRLESVGSTGSPLSPEGFDWVYEHVGADTWLFSTSGGTDVCTAFVGGVPLLPVYLGELQGRALGAKVEAFDEEGRSVVGEVGELVITEPMPSMPLYFWNDPDGERYRESYFSMYPGVWRHGDWIEITPRGTAIIYGRSDSTINRGGVRMGTSEIYRAVLGLDDVVDALVVDVPVEGAESWMPLFVVLREGAVLDDDLVAAIRKRIREDCSPRHVPNEVVQIHEVPRTLSGKVLEVPVKRILMGTPPGVAASRDSLANPRALDVFVELAAKRA
ncbi:MAG: acetoacetyl-CoA synthase [Solirubrobacterales bacterium]|nr:acetoacetyl-CoA synthase [Solirubrobacterales bacterium]